MKRHKPGAQTAMRTAVRFPLKLKLRMETEDGMIEAITRDVSSNGLLFLTPNLPAVGSSIEFTMDMPSDVMGTESDLSIHCTGRVVRHHESEDGPMAAAVIDHYFLKA